MSGGGYLEMHGVWGGDLRRVFSAMYKNFELVRRVTAGILELLLLYSRHRVSQ